MRRSTKETNVEVSINLDGNGVCTANTPVHFLNHMLDVSPDHPESIAMTNTLS